MDKKGSKANIIFITNNNTQSHCFKNYIESQVPLSVEVIDSNSFESELIVENDLIIQSELPIENEFIALVDLSVNNIGVLAPALGKMSGLAAIVLLNCSQDIEFKELVKWKNLHGCFGVVDDCESICNGLYSISTGENWLPRKIINQLLSFYQKNDTNRVADEAMQVDLTRREIEILDTLKTGESNTEIANKLFISEHTIKSHLYNIFKKIGVKNRLQAVAWAKKYL